MKDRGLCWINRISIGVRVGLNRLPRVVARQLRLKCATEVRDEANHEANHRPEQILRKIHIKSYHPDIDLRNVNTNQSLCYYITC